MQSNLIRAGNRLAEIMPSQVGAEATITRIGTINTVYDTGGYWTADVDMSGGTLMGLQMTTDCVGARAGDRCVGNLRESRHRHRHPCASGVRMLPLV